MPPVQTLSELENSAVCYSVHKRQDRYATWNFNLSVNKINNLSLQGNFYAVFHCNYESPDEVIFAIPSSFLNGRIFPYAHQTNGSRYMINVNKTTYQFNWQRSIKMDGRPFIVEKSHTPDSDEDY